jgi:hypothetical protein
VRAQYAWGHLLANYSYYNARDRNAADSYIVPGHPELMLGFPAHKATAQARYRATEHLSVAPSVVVMSPRWGYLTGDGAGNGTIGATSSTTLANLYISYDDLGLPGLSAGVGVFNAFDAGFGYLQPYNGGHPALPGLQREWVARVHYSLPLDAPAAM